MNDPLKDLEEKLAFIENTLEKLNEVVVEQAEELNLVKKEILFLKDKIFSLEKGAEPPVDQPPPHY